MSEKQFLKEINALLQKEKVELAVKLINESQYRNRIDTLKVLGNAYIRLGLYELAAQTFRTLRTRQLKKNDKEWVALNLAVILRETNNPEEAKEILKKIIEENPEDPLFFCELGNCYFDLKEISKAEQNFLKALRLIGNLSKDSQDEYNKAQIYSYAAWFFKETGKKDVAIRLYKKALSIDPLNQNLILWLADTLNELGNFEVAKKYYLKARQFFPENNIIQAYVSEKLKNLT